MACLIQMRLKEHFSGGRSRGGKLWAILMFNAW
jgi:hypothetical protein